MSKNTVWFVTGASKGLGLTLVKKLLGQDYKVAATSRKLEDLEKAVGHHANFLPLQLNLLDENDVKKAINSAVEHFGELNVVVNNAGYGQVGPFEEVSDKQARENFEVNVFGTFNVIRNALPQLRKQRYGHIFNISSIAGYYGFMASGIYSATKFAVEGMSESLAQEVKPLGINVTSVKPGEFRTNFLSTGSLSARGENPIDDYDQIRNEQEVGLGQSDRNQQGDPDKGMDLLIRISKEVNPPLHLFLGPDAYEVANNKIKNVQKDMEDWKDLATSTNFNE
ncbi:SDR family oxidoreductase [Priestia megaterium]|uniref:SDR family oxidoreductase n=1 Tax=Priestia megaterium TaxID=1404 RepID=UPI00279550A7|nr:SDR family oxidoreductase [Priestia megaterium]